MLGQYFRSQLVVPLCSGLRNHFEAPQSEQLGVETHVCHAGVDLLGRHALEAAFHAEVGLVVELGVVKLVGLDPDDTGALSAHLVELFEQFFSDCCLLLVESLHCGFDLLNGIKF